MGMSDGFLGYPRSNAVNFTVSPKSAKAFGNWGSFALFSSLHLPSSVDAARLPALPVIAKPRPFDGREWLFELKYDGFRSLAYLEHGRCHLISRNGHAFSSFDSLAVSLAKIPHEGVILDGEIACVDAKGQPHFNDLLFRRREPCFFAFDLLHLNGNDCRRDSLAQRKLALRQLLVSGKPERAIYVDHVEAEGRALYSRVCALDLEGIVAKHKHAPYLSETTISTWYKIRNPRYSQMIGRHELFERERHSEPVAGWHGCDLACAELDYAKV
jgi:bifunctional non-homologous end joining protein LigD